jgi:hypothetical protein
MGGVFDKHLVSKGTERQLTPHNTPQLNGAAEHLNGTIAGQMHALLIASGLPKSFWGLAVMYVVWLRTQPHTDQEDSTKITVRSHDGQKARPESCTEIRVPRLGARTRRVEAGRAQSRGEMGRTQRGDAQRPQNLLAIEGHSNRRAGRLFRR